MSDESVLTEYEEKYRTRISEPVRHYLIEEGFVEEAKRKKSLLPLVKGVTDYTSEQSETSTLRSRANPKTERLSTPELSELSVLCAEARSAYFGAHAGENSSVTGFRSRVLGASGKLSSTDAYALLASAGTRVLSRDQFEHWGVPIVGHKVTHGLPRRNRDAAAGPGHDGPILALTFDPPGNTFILRSQSYRWVADGYRWMPGEQAPDFPAGIRYDSIRDAMIASWIELDEDDGFPEKQQTNGHEADIARVRKQLEDQNRLLAAPREEAVDFRRVLQCPAPDGSAVEVLVWPGSVLDELRAVAIDLSVLYGWQAPEAAWFVLTGEVPLVLPIRGEISSVRLPDFSDVRATLRISPRAGRSEVLAAYRALQARSLCSRDNRSIDERSAEVFLFVTQQVGIHPPAKRDPQWQSLLDAWNEGEAESQRLEHPSRLRQIYYRARQFLVTFPYLDA